MISTKQWPQENSLAQVKGANVWPMYFPYLKKQQQKRGVDGYHLGICQEYQTTNITQLYVLFDPIYRHVF